MKTLCFEGDNILNNNIDVSSKIINSQIGENITIYKNAYIKNVILGNQIIIGDDGHIINSSIKGFNAINKRNFIQNTTIDHFTYTGFNTVIRAAVIKKFCSISWNVSIGGKNHDFYNATTSALWGFHNMYGTKPNPISEIAYKNDIPHCIINNDVLISTNAVILRDLEIGNGAVIGAGAVVTKDVEPYSIVVGVPAKKIKMRFSDKIIEALEEIKWWDWPVEIIKNNLELIYSTKVDESVIDKLREIGESIK